MRVGLDLNKALNKLAKWRSVFAAWQLGTRPKEDGEFLAVRDHREATMLMRAELNAIKVLCVKKGVFTDEELSNELAMEALILDAVYEKEFPGYRSSEEGMHLDVKKVAETQARLHFPP